MSAPARARATMHVMASVKHRPHEAKAASAVELIIIGSLHFWPRLFILGFAIFSRQIGDAFSGWVVWVGGFLVLPWTTITYAIMWGINSDRVYGVEWVFVGFAFLLDLFTWWSTLRKG
jgi:hypothetical protein